MSGWLQQFLSVTLPLMVTFVAAISGAQWSQNKHLGELSKRLDDFRADMNGRFTAIDGRLTAIEARLTSIEGTLREHGTRMGRVEGMLSPVARP